MIFSNQYEYNEKGLVTKITRVDKIQDENGNATTKLVSIAIISYPQSDRAVMLYTEDSYMGFTSTYTFAFGENHFANRGIETESDDSDGDTYMTKFSYDNEGHVTSIRDEEDHLKMEWTNGNLTKVMEQDEDDAYAVLTYGDQTDFERYNMSPSLLDVNLGPFMANLEWWYERGLKYAFYIGFLGKTCQNLPATITGYDNVNPDPEHKTFSYYYDEYTGIGMWYN